jgi:hypothetical protein
VAKEGDAEAMQMLRKALDKFREVEGYELVLNEEGGNPVSREQLVEMEAVEMRHLLYLPSQNMQLFSSSSDTRESVQLSAGFVRIQIESDDDEEEEEEEEDHSGLAHHEEIQPLLNDLDESLQQEAQRLMSLGGTSEDLAMRFKETGNDLVKGGRNSEAIQFYTISLFFHRSILTSNNRAQAKLNIKVCLFLFIYFNIGLC